MSMLRQAAKDQLDQRLYLLYSNRRPEDAAFLAELQELERQTKHFRLIATMTEMSKSSRPWDGQTSLIDGALVKKLCGDLPAPIYYLAGPSAMLDALRQTLIGTSINDDDIRSDEFYGY